MESVIIKETRKSSNELTMTISRVINWLEGERIVEGTANRL